MTAYEDLSIRSLKVLLEATLANDKSGTLLCLVSEHVDTYCVLLQWFWRSVNQ